MTTPQAAYVASFIEGSLGLAAGSLLPERVPGDLAEELTSVMRGSPPRDPTSPSLESRIRGLLPDLEREALEEDGYFVRKARWPGAAPLAVCLTHDVDNVERPKEHIEKVRSRFSRADYGLWRRGKLSLYDNFDLIAKREAAAGFRSSFYLMSAEYPLEEVRPTVARLHARGWEIGLHGDFGTHDSQEKMDEAVERLAKGIRIRPRGLREHYLRFDFSSSWRIMEAAGFDYDSTPGNADTLGFKLGLATPFHPPDEAWRPMRLLELPLSLMETTLWGYLKKEEKDGLEDVLRFMAMVEGVEGLFTLLWHQESVRMRGGRMYWEVLRELRRRNGLFVGSGADVSKWWRAREVPLNAKGGRLITLGGRPPKGLTLILKARAGAKVRVSSGVVRRRGKDTLVSPSTRAFKLEVGKR